MQGTTETLDQTDALLKDIIRSLIFRGLPVARLPEHGTPREAQLLERLRLHLVPGVGPLMHLRLLQKFGSAGQVLKASTKMLQDVEGVGPKLSAAIGAASLDRSAEQILARCREAGYQLLEADDVDFPDSLKSIPDVPQMLFVNGEILPRDHLAIAIVGSRRCTVYGVHQAEKLANALARAGVTIVSGLAQGIDTAAHRGALAAGGRTIAVLATGLDSIYPPENTELAAAIAKNGAVVSEAKLDQHPSPGIFPQRNRIISGLSMGVLIIEAARNSGALHTARHALEQGREVMALPGRVDSLASDGCHDLIRDGATLIRHADDVLKALGPTMKPVSLDPQQAVHSPRELTLNDQERAVLNLVTSDPQHLDQILSSTALDASRVLATLTVLEMKRLVRRQPGGYLVRVTY